MNEDKIAYVVIDNGIEGRSPDRIVFASYAKNEQIDFLNKSANKNWYRLDKKIINENEIIENVSEKLDALEELIIERCRDNQFCINEDKIAYVIVDTHEDEDGVERTVFATLDKNELEDFYAKQPKSLSWYFKKNQLIINEKTILDKSLKKLDGLERFVYKLPSLNT